MNAPLITIGLTCYNAEKTIARALASAVAQTYSHCEILVVDDASTDSSPTIVAACAAKNPAIRLIDHDQNRGPGAARQTLLTEARGEFLVFFDDDDESLPARVQTQYDRLIAYEIQNNTTLVACYAGGQRLYPNGYSKNLPAIGAQQIIPHGDALADFILFNDRHKNWCYGSGTPACALMARRATFEKVGGFDASLRRVEDLDFAIRLSLAGGHFIGCPENLFIQHATTASDKAPRKNLDAELLLAEKYRDYLESRGMADYAQRWPWVRYYHFNRQHGRMLVALATLLIKYPIRAGRHFLRSATRRFLHEQKITRGAAS